MTDEGFPRDKSYDSRKEKTVKVRLSIAIAALCLCPSAGSLPRPANLATSTADWPQWRGPNRDGISKESGLLKQWPKEGPKLLWQLNDIGDGFSGPSVVGTRIYLMSNRGLDNEFVQALSTEDGKVIWTTRVGKVGNPDQNPNYPSARSTPTVDGNLIYALGSDGDLVCLEAKSGKYNGRKASEKTSPASRTNGPMQNLR
jgi:outer membrane protein assembly factor BamB